MPPPEQFPADAHFMYSRTLPLQQKHMGIACTMMTCGSSGSEES